MDFDKNTLNNDLTVKIEKLSNLGYGIAKIDGYIIFVENGCPGDTVKIQIYKKNKNFSYAKIIEIVEPSKHRIKPFCKMHKACGSCQLQHIDYSYQLECKKEIAKDTIKSICKTDIEIKDVISSPEILEYRHKIQYPVSETKDSKRIIAGYYKPNSHELVNIKHCSIQPSYCDEIIEFIRNKAKECNISGYYEKKHTGDLRHVIIRASKYENKYLVTLVFNSTKIKNNYKKLANLIYTELSDIAGVGINLNNLKTNLILNGKTETVEGLSYVEEKLCDKIFKIEANTFFQINPYTANNIFKYIKNYISENYVNPSILDAYAGIAAFGICLSDIAQNVVSVEEVKDSVDLAKNIVQENNIRNIEIYNMDAGEFFKEQLKKGKTFDITILDPPRKGCTIESLNFVQKLTKQKIIYVSCNPATLARDLKYLINNGCKVEYIQPFDMFCHTYHIESVAVIEV